MAKKKKTAKQTIAAAKKTITRRAAKTPLPPPRRVPPVYTYKVMAAGKPDELVQCHEMNVYGDSALFNRLVATPSDPDRDWTTILAIPTRHFDRIELVEDVPTVETADQPPDPSQG